MSKRFTLIKFLLKGLSKRKKIIISALLLFFGLSAIQLLGSSWRYQAIGVLILLTIVFSIWSLNEGLKGIVWLTVLILPSLFTASVGLFYFLTPASWLTRLPVVILFGVGLYALLLIENIFSVAAIRTIQLSRSAQAVGFLLTLLTAFFLYDTIFSFRFTAWFNFFLVGAVSFFLILQGLWCIVLEEKISSRTWLYTFILSLVQAEIALVISFWPVTVTVGSLALTTGLYTTLGLTQHCFGERLFQKTINEYLAVAAVVLMTILLTTHWGG